MFSIFDEKSAGRVSDDYPSNRVLVLLLFFLLIFGGMIVLTYAVGRPTLTEFLGAVVCAAWVSGWMFRQFKKRP